MLIISSFNPSGLVGKSVGISRNKNADQNKHYLAQSKPMNDSVSFKAIGPEPITTDPKKINELISYVSERYSNVLGKNFDKKFLTPVNEFLKKHEVFALTRTTLPLNIGPRKTIVPMAQVDHGYQIWLFDKSRNLITQPIERSENNGVAGITRNSSKLDMFSKLVNGELQFHKPEHSIAKAEIPEELKETTNKLTEAMKILRQDWYYTKEDDIKAKGNLLKDALNTVMPEG